MNNTNSMETQDIGIQPSNTTNNNQPSTDYLSTTYTLQQQLMNNPQNNDVDVDNKEDNPKCQTPPIIKTLFGNTMHNISISDDNIPDDNDTNEIKQKPTPMGGNVYLGFADKDRPVLFQNINIASTEPIDDESKSNEKSDNILASSAASSNNSNSNSSSNSSDSGNDSNDWIPSKPINNSQLLMGYMDNNDIITFNSNNTLLLSLNENNEMKNDNDAIDIVTPQYTNFNNGERINVDSMLQFAASSENSAFTSSNMSLASVALADMVINSSATNLKQIQSNISLLSNASNTVCVSETPKNVTDFARLSRWMITTFNVFIEYFPYKNIIEEIFSFCNRNINDEIFIHCNLNFLFPNVNELLNDYNYYDYPEIYVENVNSINRHQPSLVLMIGAPGSGKSSYACYRYGKENVIAADDYFDINYNGQFIGEFVSDAHEWCLNECKKRLKQKKTVVIANTHSNFWQLYDKIIPVLFDETLPHKIVFCIMPEHNPTTLVRRCIHSCTKPKIIQYLQNIKYMKSIGVTTDNILIYGNKNKENKKRNSVFDYGLWIEPESYYNLQDWYQHYTNENLFENGQVGDGRISPIISETWQVFKKNMKRNNILINKFNASNDPFIDLEIKIIGYTNHRICQMVTVEIISKSIQYNGNKFFWDMFENRVNISMMGCILSMKKNIPFSTAKLLFDYNCLQYINDGPVVQCKLATKRYIQNYLKYFKPPVPIKSSPIKKKKVNNNNIKYNNNKNIFFSLEDVITSHDVFKHNKVIDKTSFGLKLIENNKLNPNAKEFSLKSDNSNNTLNANAKEFKIERDSNDTLNPSAVEFKPQAQPMSFVPQMLPTQIPFMPAPAPQQWLVQPMSQLLNSNNNNNSNGNGQLNADAKEFKMDMNSNNNSMGSSGNGNTLNPIANEFKPNILQQQQQQFNNNIIYQQQPIESETWDIPLLDIQAPAYTPNNINNGIINNENLNVN